MTKLMFMTMILLSGTLASARGGMIGGGDVTYKALMTCDAAGMDPTFPGSPYVSVAKEVDFDGQIIPDANLRVITLNARLEPVRYYVTHDTDLSVDPDDIFKLALWQYEVGSTNNTRIGGFTWDKASKSGSLSAIVHGNQVEELQLSNCILLP